MAFRTKYLKSFPFETSDGTVKIVINFADYRLPRNLMMIDVYNTRLYQGEYLDYISFQEYGDANLMPIIALYNGIRHISAIERGTIIKIPNKTRVMDVLQRLNMVLNSDGTRRKGQLVYL